MTYSPPGGSQTRGVLVNVKGVGIVKEHFDNIGLLVYHGDKEQSAIEPIKGVIANEIS